MMAMAKSFPSTIRDAIRKTWDVSSPQFVLKERYLLFADHAPGRPQAGCFSPRDRSSPHVPLNVLMRQAKGCGFTHKVKLVTQQLHRFAVRETP
jgi:hypothetical protein